MSGIVPRLCPVSTHGDSQPPDGWSWAPLAGVARLESGHTPSRKVPAYWDGGDVPWLSLKDIRALTGKYVVETTDHPTSLGIKHSSARILPKGTVALCRTASVGKVFILGRDMATSQDFVNWVCSPRILPEYLYWAFQSSGALFELEKQGSTHQTIYMPVAARFQVLLPPVEEQKRIVSILDAVEALREKRTQAIHLLHELKFSVLMELVRITLSCQNRPRVFFAELLLEDLRNGVSPSEAGGVLGKVLTLSAITQGIFDPRASKSAMFAAQVGREKLVDRRDLLICRGNGNKKLVGSAHFPTVDMPDTAFPDTIIAARINDEKVTREYLEAIWTTSTVRSQIERTARTTNGTYKINQTALRSLEIPLPPVALQRAFATRVCDLNSVTRAQQESLDDLEAMATALGNRAFKGEL